MIVVASGVLALVLVAAANPHCHRRAGIDGVDLGVFAVLVKAPTPAGRKLLDEIEGLKLYLSVAERDELKSLPVRARHPRSTPSATKCCCPTR